MLVHASHVSALISASVELHHFQFYIVVVVGRTCFTYGCLLVLVLDGSDSTASAGSSVVVKASNACECLSHPGCRSVWLHHCIEYNLPIRMGSPPAPQDEGLLSPHCSILHTVERRCPRLPGAQELPSLPLIACNPLHLEQVVMKASWPLGCTPLLLCWELHVSWRQDTDRALGRLK